MTMTELEIESEKEVLQQRRASRAGVVGMLILSLIGVGATRQWAMYSRASAMKASQNSTLAINTNGSLGSMSSFATTLLLGGLRGPLAMMLWTSSENQKTNNNIEDIDTKIEWIRLLQPEFDSVHLFEIWNKAFNLSVKMSSLNNKYTTILDAIDYGEKVDKDRPDNLNILSTLAMVYSDKMGRAAEAPYYTRKIRHETQTLFHLEFPLDREQDFRDQANAAGWSEADSPLAIDKKQNKITALVEPAIALAIAKTFTGSGIVMEVERQHDTAADQPTFRRERMDPVVDAAGNVLSELLVPRFPRPADRAPDAEWYDGSKFQFLKQYEPFPYGVSTFALAYNDYMRSRMLLKLGNQHPLQTGDPVVDSRPFIALEQWAIDEYQRGRRFEMSMWGKPVLFGEDADIDNPTAGISLSTPIVHEYARQAAIYSYDLSARLFRDLQPGMLTDMEEYENNRSTFRSHIDDARAGDQMMQADADYLKAISATGPDRDQLQKLAIAEYLAARKFYTLDILKYNIDESIQTAVYPKDASGQPMTGIAIENAKPEDLDDTLQRAMDRIQKTYVDSVTKQYNHNMDTFYVDRNKYIVLLQRISSRLGILQGSTATQPATNP